MAAERLISLDAIIKKLKYDLQTCEPVEVYDDCFTEYIKRVIPKLLQDVIDYLENQPTVDAVEVVHARWKYYHKQNIAVCTNCSFERDLDVNFGKAVSCPNCGAKMDGGADDGL